MKLGSKEFLLIAILLLSLILRFYKLGLNPPSLNWDETSNAYNAYSILKTGRDEYGNFLPIANRSFDDYKPPIYMYATIPSVAVFGLTPFAARLPAALFGFLTVPLFYFLAKELFRRLNTKNREQAVLFATLMFSISPWALHFSRVGFEATIGLFFTVATSVFLLKSIRNPKFLILSAAFGALSLYAYHAQRIFVPLFIITSLIIFKDKFLKFNKKYLFASALITFVMIAPLLVFLPSQGTFKRLQSSALSLQENAMTKSSRFQSQDANFSNIIAYVLHGKRSILFQSYFENYLSNFDINFLFLKGDDNYRHHIEGMGLLYLFYLPLITIGTYLLIGRINKITCLLFSWLILAPLPSAPVTPAPHAIRSFLMIIPLSVIASYAFMAILNKKGFTSKVLTYILALWIVTSIGLFMHNYFIHYPLNKASEWQYGYKEAVLESAKLKNDFDKVKIHKSLEQSYIFWLFYTKYDPATYQKTGTREHFDKYYFDQDPSFDSRELFISTPPKVDEIAPVFPRSFKILSKIYYPDSQEAFRLGREKKETER